MVLPHVGSTTPQHCQAQMDHKEEGLAQLHTCTVTQASPTAGLRQLGHSHGGLRPTPSTVTSRK